MTAIRWGIIGSGKIAKRFANDLKHLPDARLAGVTSRSFANSSQFAAEFSTTAYNSIGDLLTTDVDVIYVATPHPRHLEHTLAALDAGKPVLCEKPFAMNVRESEIMIARAREKNVFLMEAMWTRFFPAITEVIELVKSGKIGRVQRIESTIGYQAAFDPNSRIFSLNLGGGSLLDIGVYCISFAQMLMKEFPTAIDCNSKISSTGADESTKFKLTYASGTHALGFSSVIEKQANEARIQGEAGEIRIPMFWCPKEFFINGEAHRFESPGQGFQFEAQEVMNCLREGLKQSPRMSHQHTLDVMRIMDAMRVEIGLRYPGE